MINLLNNPTFFQTPQYWQIVQEYFAKFLKDEGQDLTSQLFFSADHTSTAKIISKSSGTLAGLEETTKLLTSQNLQYQTFKQDSQQFQPQETLLKISGNTRQILKLERTILNVLTRMPDIATYTKKLTKISQKPLAATRKTLYGPLDKKAVYLGGGLTHRINLQDAILIKDTHWDHYNRNIQTLLDKIHNLKTRFIDIETASPQEAISLIKQLPTQNNLVVMFDNFTPQQITQTIIQLQKINLRHKALLEASGGINETNLQSYAQTNIDLLSLGCLTKNPHQQVDLTMKISDL